MADLRHLVPFARRRAYEFDISRADSKQIFEISDRDLCSFDATTINTLFVDMRTLMNEEETTKKEKKKKKLLNSVTFVIDGETLARFSVSERNGVEAEGAYTLVAVAGVSRRRIHSPSDYA